MIGKSSSFNFIQSAVILYNNKLQIVHKKFFIINEREYNYLVKEKNKKETKIKSIKII